MGLEETARGSAPVGVVGSDSQHFFPVDETDATLVTVLRELGIPTRHGNEFGFHADPEAGRQLLEGLGVPNVVSRPLPSRREWLRVAGAGVLAMFLGPALVGCLGSAPQTNQTRPGGSGGQADPFAYDPENGLGPTIHEFQLGSSTDENEPEHPYTGVYLLYVTGRGIRTAEVTIDGKTYLLKPFDKSHYVAKIPGHLSPMARHSLLVNLIDASGYTRIAGQVDGVPTIHSTIPNAYLKPRFAGTFIGGPVKQDDETFVSSAVRGIIRFGAGPSDVIDISGPLEAHQEVDLAQAPRQQPILLQVDSTHEYSRAGTGKASTRIFRCVLPIDLSRTIY